MLSTTSDPSVCRVLMVRSVAPEMVVAQLLAAREWELEIRDAGDPPEPPPPDAGEPFEDKGL